MKKSSYLKVFFATTLMVSQSIDLFSQTNEVERLAKTLGEHNVYEWSICPKSTEAEQISNFEKLASIATDEELIELLKSKNSVVTAYAFSALVKREHDSLTSYLYDHLDDFRKLEVLMYGCDFIHGNQFETTVANFVLNESNDHINADDKTKIDSLLLFSTRKYEFLAYLLNDKKFDKKYHDRIKELGVSHKYKSAPIALARFQDTTDLKILEKELYKNPYNTISLIEIFPHAFFKTFISTYGKKERKLDFMLYKAAAIYQDTFALNFLTSEFNNLKDDYSGRESSQYLYEAVLKYKSPIYDSLFFDLWERNYLINDTLFLYLVGVNRERSEHLAVQSLKNINRLKSHSGVINEMLYYLVNTNKKTAQEIIVEQLKGNKTLYYYPEFAENARYFKEKEVVNALFARLEIADNAHIYYPIIEALLYYKDDNINEKLIETIKNNKEIDDWGFKKTKKILKEYNLTIE